MFLGCWDMDFLIYIIRKLLENIVGYIISIITLFMVIMVTG